MTQTNIPASGLSVLAKKHATFGKKRRIAKPIYSEDNRKLHHENPSTKLKIKKNKKTINVLSIRLRFGTILLNQVESLVIITN